MKFNTGKFVGNKYIKRVNFSKAVLWKDKQISLSTIVTRQFKTYATSVVIFEDEKKGKRWEIIGSTRKLTTEKFIEYCGMCQQWAMVQGINIPNPNEIVIDD